MFFFLERLFNTWQPRMLEKPSSWLAYEGHAQVALRAAVGGWGALRESFSASVAPVLQEGRCISTEIITATSGRLSASHTAASSTWASSDVSAPAPVPALPWQLEHSTEMKGKSKEPRWPGRNWAGVSSSRATDGMNPRKGCVLMWEHLQNKHRIRVTWVGKGIKDHRVLLLTQHCQTHHYTMSLSAKFALQNIIINI